MEELFGLELVAHGVDHEVEVVKGEILAVVSMFFEDDGEAFDGEDGLEDVEVFAEEEVGLHDDLVGADVAEGGILLDGPVVGLGIVAVDLLQTPLHLLAVEHH